MAGNLVKWWKHKILGGYKQFSVQECTTDSEDLMFQQVRASSSCSAPPDLLLVSDRENNFPLRSDMVHVISATPTPPSTGANSCPVVASANNNQKIHHQHQHHYQQQQKPHTISSKDLNGKHQTKAISGKQVQPDPQQQLLDNEVHVETQQSSQHHQKRSEEHIRLEEFTCDVSVEGGKSSQPLQFSFTFYDLDGHHGKITKDDIVGIVYTIYESIGKSVVVPHSGSKTINVRLTVSPEGKSKATKSMKKVAPNSVSAADQQNVSSQKGVALSSGRRLHRYRPRKLIKSDEEDDDDSNSDKDRETPSATNATSAGHLPLSSKPSVVHKTRNDQQCCQLPSQGISGVDVNIQDSIYDQPSKGATETCRECLAAVDETGNAAISPTHNDQTRATHLHSNSKSVANEAYMKHVASTRIKMLRKSRKQKYQDCMQTRQRSLSVGNETCWNNRHLQKAPPQQLPWNADQQPNNTDVLDGVQLRNPLQLENMPGSQKRNSAECWKTALNRNDLISIIRESMEKNRLCFQLNGKPQANVSPIRQSTRHQQQHHLLQHKHSQHQPRAQQRPRQRSNTVSKIPMLISKNSNRSNSFSNNNDSSLNEHQNSNSIFHLQPHIPIYQSQMGVNPAVLGAQNGINVVQKSSGVGAGQHSKMNLCGYDSFLHATICGGGLSHSPPPNTPPNYQAGATPNSHHNHHQQIATVQPIMSSFGNNSHHIGLSTGANKVKTSKILRSASYSQAHQAANAAFTSSQNSPQYHGYQRLPSSNKQNMPPLNLTHHSTEKSEMELSEKRRKDHVKNYDQLLYAKLAEKLQQTSLATTSKESVQRRKHRVLRHRRSNAPVAQANKVCDPTEYSSKTSEYTTLIPFGGDPVECENLIVQTSEDESPSLVELATGETTDIHLISNASSSTRHVAEGTLVDLEDVDAAEQRNIANCSSNMPVINSDNNELHLDDDLEIDDELDEDLADLEEIAITESGRNSTLSNDPNGATVANTNGANTSATSSLIHRYVHEHIHHHYHHFEEKDE